MRGEDQSKRRRKFLIAAMDIEKELDDEEYNFNCKKIQALLRKKCKPQKKKFQQSKENVLQMQESRHVKIDCPLLNEDRFK